MSKTMTISRKTMLGLGVGVLVVGVLAGAVGAQVILARPRFLNTGLFTLGTDEVANFHVALDDRAGGPPARVLLQLFKRDGSVADRKEAILGPGESTTLQIVDPGLYRAHAQILEPDGRLGARRIVLGTVEIGSLDMRTFGVAAVVPIRAPIRFACSSDDGSDNGRNPD